MATSRPGSANIVTTVEEVTRKFLRTGRARQVYTDWHDNPKNRHVVAVVDRHDARAFYTLTRADIEQTCRQTDHPLGNIPKHRVEGSWQIRDWRPDFAFSHLLHYQLEQTGALPTWQEFRGFLFDTPNGRDMFGDATISLREDLVREGHARAVINDAMRWRVGLAYYGLLREIFTIVELRARGLELPVHPMADALFRADAWIGDTVLSIRVANKLFRHGNDGRKNDASDLLGGDASRFLFHKIELQAATKFGVVHLPGREDIDLVAQSIVDAAAP